MTTKESEVDVLAAERDARTIYDIACIREDQIGASREDVEFKAIALRNYQFCAAVAEVFERAEYLCRTGEGMIALRTALRNVGVKV